MKKITILLMMFSFISFFFISNSIADEFDFRLSTNKNALDSEMNGLFNISNTVVMPGISVVYDNDDYKILFLKALITNEVFIDGLTGGLGFKGAWGRAEKSDINGDVLNLGFMCYASYDLSKTDLNHYPVILSSSLCFSPEPLSFVDTKEFIEILAECSWKILDQASLVLNYRYIGIDFTNSRKWRKSDSTGYIGLKFSF